MQLDRPSLEYRSMADRHLPKFDPAASFKAATNMRFAGRAILKGAPIDKSQLPEATRDRTLQTLYENHRITVASPEQAAKFSPEQRGELTDDQQARVAELVNSNSREELDSLAAGEPYNIAEPEKLANKEAVATAIVRAEAGAA
jgi:hypothetical protein